VSVDIAADGERVSSGDVVLPNFVRSELLVQLSGVLGEEFTTEARAIDKGECMDKGIIRINGKAKGPVGENEHSVEIEGGRYKKPSFYKLQV
jgi:phage tail sheath gpL-like